MVSGRLIPVAADHIWENISPPKNTGPQGTSFSIMDFMARVTPVVSVQSVVEIYGDLKEYELIK